MDLVRNKIHTKNNRRGNLVPIKSPSQRFFHLSYDSKVYEIKVDKNEVSYFQIKQHRNSISQLDSYSSTLNIRISNKKADGNKTPQLFKQLFEKKIKQEPQPISPSKENKLENQKQILDLFNQKAKKYTLKSISKQSMVRRLSHQNSDQNKQIQSTYNQLQTLINQKDIFNDKLRLTQLIQNKVEKTLGTKFLLVVQDSLRKLISKTKTKDQTKNSICSSLLISDLTLIRLYHQLQKNLQGAINNPFALMNKINKQIFSYLKSKYPRAKNLFVPYQINQKFQEINFLSLSQNNIMQNAGYTFTHQNASRLQVITKTKRFFNTLLKQMDQNYLKFTELLTKQAFKLQQQKRRNNVKIKIGRKLPDDTPKFYNFNNDNFEISSSQVFRVMIKWVQQMEQLLIDPSKIISERKGIKSVKFNEQGKPMFSQIRSKRLQQIKIDLIEKISQDQEFNNQMKALIAHLHEFNNNLTKTLIARQCDSAYIKQEDAQCLKFAKFNTKFLEWLIVQKFLIIVKILSKISAKFEHKFFKKLDFINFNVYDLLRASFSGKKQQIFQVFENLKRLQKEQKITIVRLKNRFSTPLNDVLINFKIKQSFLICQLQLILSDVIQEGQDKLRSMEDINHIIYQLQRSPFGPLSEMAVSLGYHDPSIDYQQRIAFKQDWFKQQICSDGFHQFFQIYDQNVPFVCSWCVKFYGRLQNFFQCYQCKKCSLKKCQACAFEVDRDAQKKVYHRYFLSTFEGIPMEQVQNQDYDYITNFFENKIPFLESDYIRVRDHVNFNGPVKLKQIEKLLYRKQLDYGLRGSQALYGYLLHFANGQSQLYILKYINYEVTLHGSSFQKSNFKLQQFDIIFFFEQKLYSTNIKNPLIFKIPGLDCKFQFYDPTKAAKVMVTSPDSIIVYIKTEKVKYLLDVIKSTFSKNKAQADKAIQQVTEKVMNNCQCYPLSRKQISLDNLGLTSNNLQIFQNKTWSKDVLVLNLSYNKITKIQNTLDGFGNLEQLYLSHNQLSELNFKNTNNKVLLILDISFNNLRQIPIQINNYTELNVLTLNDNKIQKIPNFKLSNLQQLDLDKNKIKNFQALCKSNLQSLLILQMSYNKQKQQNWIIKLILPNLKRIQMRSMGIEIQNQKLNLNNFPNIEGINISDNKFTSFQPIQCKFLRQINIQRNGLKNVQGVFTNKLIQLQVLNLQGNQIQSFPVLQLDNIRSINLSNNKLKDISNILRSFLAKLQTLHLQNNKIQQIDALSKADLFQLKQLILNNNLIKKLPKLSFNSLTILDLKQNKLTDINQLANCVLPKVKSISLRDNLIQGVPQFFFQSLKYLGFSNNKINNISSLQQLVGISNLVLWRNSLTSFPELKSKSLQIIYLYQNKIKDISNLAKSDLLSVKIISLYSNQIQDIPVLDLPYLEKVYMYKNQIKDISNLQFWKTPNLKYIDLSHNKIPFIPKIDFKQLYEIQLGSNEIQNADKLSQSSLNSLKTLNLKINKLKKIPLLNFKNLQTLNIERNMINDIKQFISQSNLPTLRQLFLNKNQIQQIPSHLNFPLIEILSLKQNMLKNFYIQNNSSLKYLQKLYLTDNKLQQFKFSMLNQCTYLYQLSLTRNPLYKWGFSQCARIKRLWIISCNLKQLNQFYLPCLQQLVLNKNVLQSINFVKQPGAMLSLSKLTLDSNRLKELPKMQLNKLQELGLLNNPLEDMTQFLKSVLPALKVIKLSKALGPEQSIQNQAQSQITNKQQMADMQVVTSNIANNQSMYLSNKQQGGILAELQQLSQFQHQDQSQMRLRKKLSLATNDNRKQLIEKLKQAFPNISIIS